MPMKGKNAVIWAFECNDDTDWLKRCVKIEIEGIRQRGRPRKTWLDCVTMFVTPKVIAIFYPNL